MTDKNQPRGHNFDGIQELDNDLPRWWVALFLVTIVFGFGYIVWYHSGLIAASNLEQQYVADVKATQSSGAATAPAANSASTASAAAAPTSDALADGKQIFMTTCSPCHGTEGQGIVGPNLTDEFWINGSTRDDVERVITKGSLEKGMPAWGEVLGPAKIQKLVAFVVSLQGTSPSGGKPPQGNPGKLQ